MPNEIHLTILKELDYKSLLAISATSTHFRALFKYDNKHLFKCTLVDYEEKYPPGRTTMTGETPYAPCYGCLKLLTKCHFPSRTLLESSSRQGVRAFRRRCVTCASGLAKEGSSRVFRYKEGNHEGSLSPWLYCAGCEMATHVVDFERCGVWDHTRDWKVWEDTKVLRGELALCRACEAKKVPKVAEEVDASESDRKVMKETAEKTTVEKVDAQKVTLTQSKPSKGVARKGRIIIKKGKSTNRAGRKDSRRTGKANDG
jgi:F-box domain